jgi:hypothetical protein
MPLAAALIFDLDQENDLETKMLRRPLGGLFEEALRSVFTRLDVNLELRLRAA